MNPYAAHKAKTKHYLHCVDYSVSRESFELLYDPKTDMLVTHPQPELDQLSNYYESENYISHTDAKKSLVDKLYQLVKKHTISKKVKLIGGLLPRSLSEMRVLDIGCGTGDFLMACQKKNWHVTGIEPHQGARLIANDKLNMDVYSEFSKIGNQQFDCITLWHVLEHIPNLENFIVQLQAKLKPEGALVIAVPNYNSFDAKHYGKFWAAYDVPRHLWHFSKKSISTIFKKVKLEVIQVLPMYFDAFYVSLLSEKYKTGRFGFIKAIIIGLTSNMKALRSKEYSSQIYILKKSK